MSTEIERKFLVLGREFIPEATESTEIEQGYLSSVPGRTVRIRIRGQKGFITIKGVAGLSGIDRYEWEKEIAVEEARELLELCEPHPVVKTRHLVHYGNHIFEVDEFHGENEGLVVAEIELNAIDESFERPSWLGEEVSHDPRYYNAFLSVKPFKNW